MLRGCLGVSKKPTSGAKTKINKNQYAVPILEIKTYMPSAGLPPIYISTRKFIANNKTHILQTGLNKQDLTFDVSSQGNNPKAAIEPNIANTPPNLSGMALKIA